MGMGVTVDWRGHISSDKGILLGKPVIRGTRLSVEFVLELLASGWTEDQILENYPITPEALQAVFAFAAECIKDEMLLTGDAVSGG
jgi:uncharacterized protein (DUF433 family)